MQQPENPQRRRFIKILGGAGASLTLGVHLAACSEHKAVEPEADRQPFEPNAWITLHPNNKIEVAITKSEMGQNILSTFVLIVAEELNTEPSMVTPRLVDPASKYGSMYTGGSSSVRSLWHPLRQAAATARMLLLQAAAKEWLISTNQCSLKDGQVLNQTTQETKHFGAFCATAKQLPTPSGVQLRPLESMRFLGKQAPLNKTTTEKVTGKARYGIDTSPKDIVFAAIKHAPVFGSTLTSLTLSDKLRNHKSTVAIVELKHAVAVVATNYWHAYSTLEQAEIIWSKPEHTLPNMSSIREGTHDALKRTVSTFERETAENTNLKQIQSPVFENSYQAHVTMEPMNCTVHFNEDGCDIWIPTQDATYAQSSAAKHLRNRLELLAYKALKKLGIADNIRVHPTLSGGGFGRRLEIDYLIEALDIARNVSAPVKVIWSREEDIQHDFYRPFSLHQLFAQINHNGEIQSLMHIAAGANKGKVTANINNLAYEIPQIKSEFSEYDPGVPTGYWRSVAYSNHIFASECFIDQIAHETKQNPLGIRQGLLKNSPRALKLLGRADHVVKTAIQEKKDYGLAFLSAFGSYIVTVVTLSNTPNTTIESIYCAVDCGFALDPNNIKAQIEGGALYGLNAATKHSIHINEGKVSETNFNDYPLLTISECPKIHIDIEPSSELPGGAGELSVPVIAPALAYAIYSKTGKRPVRTPLPQKS